MKTGGQAGTVKGVTDDKYLKYDKCANGCLPSFVQVHSIYLSCTNHDTQHTHGSYLPYLNDERLTKSTLPLDRIIALREKNE